MRKLVVTAMLIVVAALGYAASAAIIKQTTPPSPLVVELGDWSRVADRYQAELVLFTTSTCGFCGKTKTYLSDRGIAFLEVAVDSNPADMDYLVEDLGRDSVPVIVRRDRLLSGYDTKQLDAFLAAPM